MTRYKMCIGSTVAVACIGAVSLSRPAMAVTTNWVGGGPGWWFDSFNWDNGVPGLTDDATVRNGGWAIVTGNVAGPAVCNALAVGDNSTLWVESIVPSLTVTAQLTIDDGGRFVVVQSLGNESPIAIGRYQQGRHGALTTYVSYYGWDWVPMSVASDASLSGTWSVTDIHPAHPPCEPGTRFEILYAAGGITGTFDTVNLPGPDWRWGIDAGTTLWVERVPEPVTALFLLGGMGVLLNRARRPD